MTFCPRILSQPMWRHSTDAIALILKAKTISHTMVLTDELKTTAGVLNFEALKRGQYFASHHNKNAGLPENEKQGILT